MDYGVSCLPPLSFRLQSAVRFCRILCVAFSTSSSYRTRGVVARGIRKPVIIGYTRRAISHSSFPFLFGLARGCTTRLLNVHYRLEMYPQV